MRLGRMAWLAPRAGAILVAVLLLAALLVEAEHALAGPTARVLASAGLALALWHVLLRARPLGPRLRARPRVVLGASVALPLAAGVAALVVPASTRAFALGALGLLGGVASAAFGASLWSGGRWRRAGGLAMVALALFAAAGVAAFGRVPVLLAVPVLVGVLQMVLRAPDENGLLRRDDAKPLLLAFAFGAVALRAAPSGLGSPLAPLGIGVLGGLALAALGGRAALERERTPVPLSGLLLLFVSAFAVDLFGAVSQGAVLVLTTSAAVSTLRLLLALRPVASAVSRSRASRGLAGFVVGALTVGPIVALLTYAGMESLVGLALLWLTVASPLTALAIPLFFALFLFGGFLALEEVYVLARRPAPPRPVARDPTRAAWLVAGGALAYAAVTFLVLRFALPAWETPFADAAASGIYGALALALLAGALAVAAARGMGRERLASRITFLALYVLPLSLYIGYLLGSGDAYQGVPLVALLLLAWATLQNVAQLPARAESGRWLAPRASWELVLAVLLAGAMGFGLNSTFHSVADTLETIDTAGLVGFSLAFVLFPAWRFVRGWRARRKGLPDETGSPAA